MANRKRKNRGNQITPLQTILLVTAILDLIAKLIDLIDRLTE